MIKDSLIHQKLGIPISTLQNWKKAEGSNQLLYQFLINQNEDEFKTNANAIIDLNKYVLMTPKEFAILVKENWSKFYELSEYEPIEPEALSGKNTEAIILAVHKKDSANILALRFVLGLSKRDTLFAASLKKTNQLSKESGFNPPRIIYVATNPVRPKYFDDHDQDLSSISYAELYEKISQKTLLII